MTTAPDPVEFVRTSDLATIYRFLYPERDDSAAAHMVLRCFDGTEFDADEAREYRIARNHGEEPGIVARVVGLVVGEGERNRLPRRTLLQKGRQGGVTTGPLVVHCLKLALHDWHSIVGDQTARYLYVAPTLDQCRTFLAATFNALRKLGVRCTKREHEVDLSPHGINVIIFADVPNALAGRSFVTIGFAGDEFPLLPTDPDAVGNQAEVLSSVTPGMITTAKHAPICPIILAGSPWRAEGPFNDTVEASLRGESRTDLALVLPTWRMNPRVTEADTHAMEPNPARWRREYRGLPSDNDDETAFNRADVERCVDRGRTENPPARTCVYLAALDCSGLRNDRWVLIIAHAEEHVDVAGNVKRIVVIDFVATWDPKKQTLDWKRVAFECAEILRTYGSPTVYRDGYAGAAIDSEFRTFGINSVEMSMAPLAQGERFRLLQAKLTARELRLPDYEPLISEVCSLRVRMLDSGKYRYEAPKGRHDDHADALALVCEAASSPTFPASGASTVYVVSQANINTSIGIFEISRQWRRDEHDPITGETISREMTPPPGTPERTALVLQMLALGQTAPWVTPTDLVAANREQERTQVLYRNTRDSQDPKLYWLRRAGLKSHPFFGDSRTPAKKAS